MSYQSFKRVMGETSLERKCRFLFGACLLLLITGSFLFVEKNTAKNVEATRRKSGQLLVDTIRAVIHWRKFETDEEFRKTVVAAMTENMGSQEYEWRAIRPEDNHPSAEQKPSNDFERDLLARYLKKAKTLKSGESVPGDEPVKGDEQTHPDTLKYVYYQPIYADTVCLTCHRPLQPTGYDNEHLDEGDLMAIIAVEFSDMETQQALSKNKAILFATAIITVFLAMILLYVIVRYVIVKPLKHLRDVADDVSQGNLEVRADIHTGDEFEEVAESFNRMLRHLVAAQQELRHVNSDLDGKVDELAQANMRLHEMNRLKGDFLATMSHELRTPLNSIIGFSDVLSSIDSLDEKQSRYVGNIQKSGRMLLEMINDILDLAKIESGRMELRLSDFNIDTVVAAQCDMARPLAEKKNIDLEVHVDEGLPPLHQDQGKVQQILNNLLSNAIKFTPEGGRITVSASQDPQGDALLIVNDTGVGIAEEDQLAVFEKFRQGGDTVSGADAMTREYSGTGLGLSIVKELCKLLGGEISLESELGRGSTFTVRLSRQLARGPRLDSPLAEGLDELTKPRAIDFQRPFLLSPPAASSETDSTARSTG